MATPLAMPEDPSRLQLTQERFDRHFFLQHQGTYDEVSSPFDFVMGDAAKMPASRGCWINCQGHDERHDDGDAGPSQLRAR